jgi:hypothetical protein
MSTVPRNPQPATGSGLFGGLFGNRFQQFGQNLKSSVQNPQGLNSQNVPQTWQVPSGPKLSLSQEYSAQQKAKQIAQQPQQPILPSNPPTVPLTVNQPIAPQTSNQSAVPLNQQYNVQQQMTDIQQNNPQMQQQIQQIQQQVQQIQQQAQDQIQQIQQQAQQQIQQIQQGLPQGMSSDLDNGELVIVQISKDKRKKNRRCGC